MLFVFRATSEIRSFTWLRSWVIAVSQVVGLSVLFIGLAAGFSLIRFGSIRAGQAWFAGNQLFVENPRVEEVIDFSEYEAALKFGILTLASVQLRYWDSRIHVRVQWLMS